MIRMSKDFEYFLKRKDFSEYSGKWIAIHNQRVIAHNVDGEKMFKEIKGRRCLIVKIPKPNTIMI